MAWDDPTVDWSAADVVAVRSTWDYHRRTAEFLAWARDVESRTLLLNGADVFAWNADKGYLVDLDLPHVPTGLLDDPSGLADATARWGSCVVKPRVGASGVGVVVVDGPGHEPALGRGPWVVQPLVESVRTVGETSVFVFGGRAASQVDKRPGGDEVRVHEEYGGSSVAVPLDPERAALAEHAVAAVGEWFGAAPAYARIDVMRWEDALGGQRAGAHRARPLPGRRPDAGRAVRRSAGVAAVIAVSGSDPTEGLDKRSVARESVWERSHERTQDSAGGSDLTRQRQTRRPPPESRHTDAMTRQPRTRPTLEEVAAVAGVGRGTASRVINGSSKVSEKARLAVEGAIAELGYVPNRAARTLVTQRTDAVALVIAESEERVFGEPFFAGVVRGVGTALSDARLQLVLLLAHAAQRNGRLDDYLTRQHVDGVLLLSLHDDDALPDRIRARGLPVVLGGRATDHQRGAYVDADNVLGARLAVDHLVHRGRRRIGAILGPPDMVVGRTRHEGYLAGLAAAGLEVDDSLVVGGDFSQDSGESAMRVLLSRRPDLDAVFCANDLMAAGALRVLREAGRDVPGDVSVVGFDDAPLAQSTHPPLTTVHQSPEQMGREMVSLLLDAMAHPDEPPTAPAARDPPRGPRELLVMCA